MSDEARYDAMVEFIGCFPTLSGDSPSSLNDLSDGVTMFEALSDIDPDHFDPSSISPSANWALRANNLRKLLRSIETYCHTVLQKTTDFGALSETISGIARDENLEDIADFCEVITAIAVTCEDRGRYVSWIMGMEGSAPVAMKGVIESSLARLEDLDESNMNNSNNFEESYDHGHGGDHHNDDVSGMLSDDDFEGGAEISKLFGNAMKDLDHVTENMDVSIAINSEYSNGNHSHSAADASVANERDALKVALAEAKRELGQQKQNLITVQEDNDTTQNKLRALATDLQERLERRQEELTDAEGQLMQSKTSLEDAEAKVSDLTEKNATLEDELDIAKSKSLQLKKAEATVTAYRRKLEGAGAMNQQMSEMENQSAKYLAQIVDFEMETKKIPELQKNLDDTRRALKKAQSENADIQEKIKTRTAEIANLKTDLSASTSAKKAAEEEVLEFRSMQQEQGVDDDPNIAGLSLANGQSVTEVKEKVMRLEIENKTLQKKLEESSQAAVAASDAAASADVVVVTALENEVAQLEAQLKKKEVTTAKLASDKEKLEAYTKKTLSKFQEKYLVALQECKAKLKEKHDKIEALEMRSAAEKSTQKREEKLLSSTIYELGLTIMQEKLKNR
mmetsp:Transcript_9908/g.14924  ORF Transcript_9908/g.14924 Transcript_9908/m.14924 type:complete len:624 (-) Transcript_9908:99-1970(-)|eukprot:CAMPEP_0194116598 /NCGR_PEP_ID=MMETSP0150-20130528/27823_1 /TAXON_ID=122233 /ORGANISM="Chaetoceros debilis, Strain MM31A-1" /LENGTH=623 /DNA_ID=CAMNT_0038807363 /DNA_START=219 /DNA_END=2090 /DNA_ORIENTATION=-